MKKLLTQTSTVLYFPKEDILGLHVSPLEESVIITSWVFGFVPYTKIVSLSQLSTPVVLGSLE